jgi:hypothetical protein
MAQSLFDGPIDIEGFFKRLVQAKEALLDQELI